MSLYPGWRDYQGTGAAPAKTPRRSHKYGAEAVTIDGIRFDSKLEARRWHELHFRLAAGEISDLQRQVHYALHASSGRIVGHYVADFVYLDRDSRRVIEDAKGVRTALYRWKRRHFEAEYNIQITEIAASTRRLR